MINRTKNWELTPGLIRAFVVTLRILSYLLACSERISASITEHAFRQTSRSIISLGVVKIIELIRVYYFVAIHRFVRTLRGERAPRHHAREVAQAFDNTFLVSNSSV